jgi:chitin disaccharide deacetylase
MRKGAAVRDRIAFVRTCVAVAAALLGAADGARQAGDRTIQERLGYPASARLLIIHADDLGMAHSVNRATFEALEQRLITSASILVPCPWFPEVAQWARAHPEADLGIHLALNSEWSGYRWGPVSSVSEVPSLLDAQGYFPFTEAVVVERARVAEVERELRAQIDRATAAGIRLSHLDSHMATLFGSRELFEAYRQVGKSYGLPVLIESLGTRGGAQASWQTGAGREALIDRVVSISPGVQAAGWMAAYENLLAPLPPGVYQLIVHLAYDDEEMRAATRGHVDWGAAWRQSDLDLIKSAAFRQFLQRQGFVLITWKELSAARSR